jgi:uncharacterized protein (TIGR00661 family)
LRRYLGIVGARSSRLALSFYAAPDLEERGLWVAPPLLREAVFRLHPGSGTFDEFVLVYIASEGYRAEVERWHKLNPGVEVHCFYNRAGAPVEERRNGRLYFHQIHGGKFLRLMAECRGIACTAGFESISEAAFLGKPLYVVPVRDHIEQYLNALDAEAHGLAIRGESFDLTTLLNAGPRGELTQFREWVKSANNRLESAIRACLSGPRNRLAEAPATVSAS